MSSCRRQLRFSILAAGLVLLAFAGCGRSADPLHAVRSAATNTLALTAQSTLTLTGPRLLGEDPTIVGRGEFSFPKGLGYEALQVPARGRRAPGTVYLVFLPTKLWIRPVSPTALPVGDLWVSTKLSDLRAAASTPPSLALVAEGTNPQLLLEEIATGAVAASSSGHRVVDHVPFAEYVVSVDLTRAIEATSKTGVLRIAMQQQLAALRAVGGPRAGSRVRIVARVDGAGRLAQLRFSLPGSKLGAIQIALWKFGSTIPLSLPLASQTVDIASLRLSHGALTTARMFTGE
jgi:hypothetical protein